MDVIEKDIEDVDEKCNKIQCNPIYEAIKSFFKLCFDMIRCWKVKIK